MNGAEARPEKLPENMSEKMRDIASQVIVFSALTFIAGIVGAINSSPVMGEMGPFMYVFFRVTVCFGVWGLATGIGLWRKWRWARISMLVFGGILVACGTLPPVVMMLPLGGAAERTLQFIVLKVVGLALLLVVLAGGFRWWKYFTRKSMKSYFYEDGAPSQQV